jgi:hypothetical protein
MTDENRPDVIVAVRPGETIPWQPPRYHGDLSKPIYHIKVMTGRDRRKWQARLSKAEVEASREKNPELAEKISQDAMNEYLLAFVHIVENVPGWAVGMETEETVTVQTPTALLQWLECIPGNDDKMIDQAIWSISTLEAGSVKNLICSPKSLETNGELNGSAESVETSSASGSPGRVTS